MRKLIIILLAISLLVMSFPSSAVLAKKDNKPVTPPELKNITFVHYAKPDKPGKPPVDPVDPPNLPDPVNDVYALLDIYLTGTVVYNVNPAGAPAGAMEEIHQAFDAWDDVTVAELFVYGTTTDASKPTLDGQNAVSWRKIAPRNTIAMTSVWYDPATGEIAEFDITFNSFLGWGIDPDDEGPETISGLFDVENIAVHEVGHVVGLRDLYEDEYRELTMYGYGATGETIKISLEEGDIAGAQYLYGAK